METNYIKIKTLFICFTSVIFIELATSLAVSQSLYPTMIILGLARLFEILLIMVTVQILEKGLSSLRLDCAGILPGLKKGLLWSAGFATVTLIAFIFLFAADTDPIKFIQVKMPETHSDLIVFFIVGGVIAPLAEEIFFRGVIYSFLRRWGILTAVVLSTAIFVAVHCLVQEVHLTHVVGGIVFALAYEMGGSLMVPIIIHMLGNSAIFICSMITY